MHNNILRRTKCFNHISLSIHWLIRWVDFLVCLQSSSWLYYVQTGKQSRWGYFILFWHKNKAQLFNEWITLVKLSWNTQYTTNQEAAIGKTCPQRRTIRLLKQWFHCVFNRFLNALWLSDAKNISLKTAYVKLYSNFPGINELLQPVWHNMIFINCWLNLHIF